MLIERWHKTRKCYVFDVRIRNEFGKMQLFATGHTSRSKAELFQYKKRNEIAERKMFPEHVIKKIMFKDFTKIYLKDHAAGLASERDYISICKKLDKRFGNIFLSHIGKHAVEAYLTERYKKVSVYMANREITTLKGICTKAIDWHFLRENPCKGIKLKREEPRFRILNNIEVDMLLAACEPIKGTRFNKKKAFELRAQIEISLNTGVRKSEMLNIKISDIDLENYILKVFGKGGKTRFIPLNLKAREIFTDLVEQAKGKYIFGLGKVAFKDFKTTFNSAKKRAGLEDIRPHDLRRTFGSNCAMAGVPPKTLQKWMGHSNLSTTMKYYVHCSEDFEREAIEKINDRRKHDSGSDTSQN